MKITAFVRHPAHKVFIAFSKVDFFIKIPWQNFSVFFTHEPTVAAFVLMISIQRSDVIGYFKFEYRTNFIRFLAVFGNGGKVRVIPFEVVKYFIEFDSGYLMGEKPVVGL